MDLRSTLRAELRQRARLADRLPFGAPAHCILFDLALARIEGRRVPITGVNSGVPNTTTLRYIAILIEAGLIERVDNSSDRRSGLLRITDEGFAQIEALFSPATLVRAA